MTITLQRLLQFTKHALNEYNSKEFQEEIQKSNQSLKHLVGNNFCG